MPETPAGGGRSGCVSCPLVPARRGYRPTNGPCLPSGEKNVRVAGPALHAWSTCPTSSGLVGVCGWPWLYGRLYGRAICWCEET